jgi:DNA topoisomerase-1
MDPVPMPELQCEKVDDTYLLRDGAAGLFLAASQFPKNRETRAPYIDELLPHQNEIDPKYQFLMKAPQEDPDGRRALVKFSRIEKQHYVASELEKGKASGWRADYDESSQTWVERAVEAKSSPGKRRKKSA